MLHAKHFRFYLARHTSISFRAIDDYVANVRRIAQGLGEAFELLLHLPTAQALLERIHSLDPAFQGQNDASLANCRAAVARYHEFRQWRQAQS